MKPDSSTIKSAAAKLRESQIEDEQQLAKSGYEAGRLYVLRNPNYAELRRLFHWAESPDAHEAMTSLLTVAEEMTRGDKAEAEKIDRELREDYGFEVDDSMWAAAFVDGALEVFSELEEVGSPIADLTVRGLSTNNDKKT